jgi:hypothetical protein
MGTLSVAMEAVETARGLGANARFLPPCAPPSSTVHPVVLVALRVQNDGNVGAVTLSNPSSKSVGPVGKTKVNGVAGAFVPVSTSILARSGVPQAASARNVYVRQMLRKCPRLPKICAPLGETTPPPDISVPRSTGLGPPALVRQKVIPTPSPASISVLPFISLLRNDEPAYCLACAGEATTSSTPSTPTSERSTERLRSGHVWLFVTRVS